MSASTDHRKSTGDGSGYTRADVGQSYLGPIAASAILYQGCLAGQLLSDTAKNAALLNYVADGTMRCAGFVDLGADNTGGALGARPCHVVARAGMLVDKNAGGGSAIAATDIWKPAFGVDNQTCSKLFADGPCIGIIVGIDRDSGSPMVLVDPVFAAAVIRATSITFTQTYSTVDTTVPNPTASALTDNGGGASADGTIGVVTAPSALTDNTTGVAATTLAVITSPDLSAWNGATDPSAAQATAIGAAITSAKNAIAQLAASQGQDRTAIVALTDAVKELSTGFNLLVADSLQNRKLVGKLIDVLQALGVVG